jgi:hypothetical protein
MERHLYQNLVYQSPEVPHDRAFVDDAACSHGSMPVLIVLNITGASPLIFFWPMTSRG